MTDKFTAIIKEAQDILQENAYDAIDKYVKDSKKRKELHQKAFDNYVADHVEQMNRIEKKLDGVEKGSIEAAEKAFDIKQSHDTNKNIKGQEKTGMRRAIKEAQDIVESSVFPKIAVEQGNKKFIEADKKNNETQRLYRKSLEKLNNQIKELRKSGDNEDNVDPKVYYCNRKSGRGAYQAALKTAQDLQDKAIDTRRALDAEQDRQEGLKKEGLKGVITRDIVVKPSKKHDGYAYGKVLNKNESLEILKEAQDIMSNLFEVEYYGANDVEEEQNNKIKRQGKDKHGNKVDLVSVQDELFPYEGNAKEQYNKKIIAKINDMIEGKATLEDLIQLVRNKKTPVKEAQEIIEGIFTKREEALNRLHNEYDKEAEGVPNSSKEMYNLNKKYRKLERKVNKHFDKNEDFEGAIELLEDLIQLVRNKKTPVSESEFTAHKGNPVVKITDKNYKVAHGKGLPGPFNEKQIGQYIVYNKDTDASYLVTPDNWKKSKIKRDLEREGKLFEGAIELLEAIISETSDERAHAASVESHNRFNRAKVSHDSLKEMIKSNRKTNFFSPEEIEELKGELKQKKKELENASRISVRDNRNQFNRDKRLGRV